MKRHIVLLARDDELVLSVRSRRGDVISSESAQSNGPEDWALVLPELLAKVKHKGRTDLVAEFDHGLAQFRDLSGLPPVSARELRQLVANQISKFFRSVGGPMLVDAAWVSQGGSGAIARAAAVSRSSVDALTSGAEAAGWRLTEVRPLDPTGRVALSVSTHEMNLASRVRARRRLARLAGIAIATWVLSGAVFVGDLLLDGRRLAKELSELEVPLAQFQGINARLAHVSEVVRTVEPLSKPWAVPLLNALAKSLSPPTHLIRFEMDRVGSGSIEGWSEDVAATVAEISELLPSLRLDGEPTPENRQGRDTFRFVFTFGGDGS